jgi:hypothetical protein
MPYGTFKTLEEVATKFDISINNEEFIEESDLQVNEFYFRVVQKNLINKQNFISENAICETMISPILSLVLEKHNLPLWSHPKFDVSQEDGLTGIPDFLIAPVSKTGLSFTNPVVCVAEVKKENFDEGWTQALCEMIASQRFNNNTQKPIFGIATSGEFWKFGKLIDKLFIQDPRAYSATMDLQRLFNALNWLMAEAKKTLPY